MLKLWFQKICINCLILGWDRLDFCIISTAREPLNQYPFIFYVLILQLLKVSARYLLHTGSFRLEREERWATAQLKSDRWRQDIKFPLLSWREEWVVRKKRRGGGEKERKSWQRQSAGRSFHRLASTQAWGPMVLLYWQDVTLEKGHREGLFLRAPHSSLSPPSPSELSQLILKPSEIEGWYHCKLLIGFSLT